MEPAAAHAWWPSLSRRDAFSRQRFSQGGLLESANLIWGMSLIALTIAIHTLGIVTMSLVGLRIKARQETQGPGLLQVILIVVGVVSTAGLLLAVLHGIEAAIWAATYVWLGALGLPKDAILYSLDQMTTRGASGIRLPPNWQILGALEAANGMLLFGISTAFIFTLMQAYWKMLSTSLINHHYL
jgi:hypothetical protein